MNDANWTRLYFVRHGETEWNSQGRWQGWLDSPLTPTGIRQATGAAEKLKDVAPKAIYSSDAGRALQTARIIGDELGLKPSVTESLRERYYGKYEGLNSEEIDEQFPDTRYVAGRDRRDTWRPIAGESLLEVSARVLAFIRVLSAEYAGQSLICVTHAGVLRVIDAFVSKQSLDEIWDRVPPNCAIFILDANAAGEMRVVQHFAVLE